MACRDTPKYFARFATPGLFGSTISSRNQMPGWTARVGESVMPSVIILQIEINNFLIGTYACGLSEATSKTVMPAKAGIPLRTTGLVVSKRDPSLRWGDGAGGSFEPFGISGA